RCKFWQLTSQLLALEVCLSDALRKMHFKQMCLKSQC
ncbi:DUF645 family protein, partial [Vibrio cholerae]|nr:DUF645 family protein [Vibrio cholerae]